MLPSEEHVCAIRFGEQAGRVMGSPTTIPTKSANQVDARMLLEIKKRAERLREQAKEDAGADAGGKPPGTGRG